MALVREAGGYRPTSPTKKKAPPTPTPPKIAPKSVGKAPVKVAGNKKTQTAKATTYKPKTSGKVAPTAPKVQAAKAPSITAPAPVAYNGGGGSGSFGGGGGYGGSSYGSGGGSFGGTSATTSQAPPIGAPIGSSAPTLGQTTTVGGTPSAIAQMALSTLTGSGTAPGLTRRRNRAGAGYNLSLTPEQLRNIAARRVGG